MRWQTTTCDCNFVSKTRHDPVLGAQFNRYPLLTLEAFVSNYDQDAPVAIEPGLTAAGW